MQRARTENANEVPREEDCQDMFSFHMLDNDVFLSRNRPLPGSFNHLA